MKSNRKFIIVLSSLLLAFFLIALALYVYNYYNYSEYFSFNIHTIYFAQLIVCALAAFAVICFYAGPFFKKNRGASQDISKIVLLSEANVLMEEFSLNNRTSALIGHKERVYISSENDLAGKDYAVINCVDNSWYLERVADERSVGLKRTGEQYVYKLKTGMCYRLQLNDIIYIENERLLIL